MKIPKAAAPCNQQQKRQQLIQSFAVSPVPQYVHCISFQEDSALTLFMNYSADFQLVKSRRRKKKKTPNPIMLQKYCNYSLTLFSLPYQFPGSNPFTQLSLAASFQTSISHFCLKYNPFTAETPLLDTQTDFYLFLLRESALCFCKLKVNFRTGL